MEVTDTKKNQIQVPEIDIPNLIETFDLPTFTASDFLVSTAPYEFIYQFHNNKFKEDQLTNALGLYAHSLGVDGFKGAYQKYIKSLRFVNSDSENVSQFDAQPLQLDTGDWKTDESGVWKYGAQGGVEVACTHPIMPIRRLRNIDSGELKVALAFRRGTKNKKAWTEIITGFDTISNARNITALATIGISVTSGKRAQNLVDYITDVLDNSYDYIPEFKSTSRMGWNEEGFSPYVEEVLFDGDNRFDKTFAAITQAGQYETWLKKAIEIRRYSLTAKIVLAASFASVLIEPCGVLPFFVHLWGIDSGTGKTVAQMVAASVWAEPTVGGAYFKTCRGTDVGFETLAGFLNSMPVFADETQLAKDKNGKVVFDVYGLASGSGKLRSNKTLGLAPTITWANCFITSGETPLTGENDGAGAINRVIEIECKGDEKVIENGHDTAAIVKKNYGFAGMQFVQMLSDPDSLEEAKVLYEQHYSKCMENDTTEKQAMAASILVTADTLATRWIFKDSQALTVQEMSEFLKSREAVSAADRGYQYMCDWVSQNMNKFISSSENPQTDPKSIGDVYGVIVDEAKSPDFNWVYINRTVFNSACSAEKINARALLGNLRTRGLIQTKDKGFTKSKRINKVRTDCIVMKLPDDDIDFSSEDDLSFDDML